MNPPDNGKPQLDDPRVIAALDEYLAALESGRKPDRHAFLARHAEVAEALAECVEGIEALHSPLSAISDPLSAIGGLPALGGWQPGTTPLGDFRIIREVAAADPEIAELERARAGQRLANYGHAAQLLADRGALRRGMTIDEAAAAIFAIGHPETYRALVVDGAWDDAEWCAWVQKTLEQALLEPLGR